MDAAVEVTPEESGGQRRSAPGALDPGAVVDGRYEVVAALGAGGMGEVYEVMHLGLRRRLALKCLKQGVIEDQGAINRFLKEMRGLAAIESEFVVAICDCGVLPNGSPYFVMERLRGRDLRRTLRECDGLAPVRAIKLMIDACLGVQAVHDAGLVHRDLKPENLFVSTRADQTEHCKVLDFGIAKMAGSSSTRQHSLLGTLKYMAPEQIADAAAVGPRTDVYALGAILYECLAGRPPHNADTEPELMFKVMNSEAAPLSSLVPGIDSGLSATVARALQRKPELRPASAVALAGALAACLVAQDDDSKAPLANTLREEPIPRAASAASSRPRRLWAVGAGLLLGVAIGAAVSALFSPRAPTQAQQTATVSEPRLAQVAAPSVATPALVSTLPALESGVVVSVPSSAGAHTKSTEASRGQRTPSRAPARPTLPSYDHHNPYE